MDMNEADPMRAALAKAAEQFRFYAVEHRRKVTEGTVEGSATNATIRKAEVNDQMARMCDAALGIDVEDGSTGEVIMGHPLANTIINFLSETKDGIGFVDPNRAMGGLTIATAFVLSMGKPEEDGPVIERDALHPLQMNVRMMRAQYAALPEDQRPTAINTGVAN
jgi:hypothetical protein